jgi:hypothetical protein
VAVLLGLYLASGSAASVALVPAAPQDLVRVTLPPAGGTLLTASITPRLLPPAAASPTPTPSRTPRPPDLPTFPPGTPDGGAPGEIAFVSDRDGVDQIYLRSSVVGRFEKRLTFTDVDETRPSWSPDGEWIAFMSNLGDQWDIYVMRADGTERRQLTDDSAYDEFPSGHRTAAGSS